MANVTIKDIDADHLEAVASHAASLDMSTQAFLRRLIAQEATRPILVDQLAALSERRRTGRPPMSMDQFHTTRRRAMRPT